ncbi:MAG: permease-like cell division protein FtsX [Mycoplasmatota bacterium]
MKIVRILSRNIRDGVKSVFRNFSLSFASIISITITLLVVSLSIIISQNVNNFATEVENDVTIVAFLAVDITDQQIQLVEQAINKLDNLESYEFQSKMEVSKEMMESNEVFENILSEYTETDSPLQDTYLIKVENIDLIGETATDIENIDYVDIVKYGEGSIEQLIVIFDMVRNIGFGVVIALIIVTAFLISNTIKITIFSRKREIAIMRLVGASNINIKIPFIIEGLILSILGSIIPILATIFGYNAIYDLFDGQLFSQFIKLIEPTPFIYLTSLLLLLIGIVVGVSGSYRAVKKHLKV